MDYQVTISHPGAAMPLHISTRPEPPTESKLLAILTRRWLDYPIKRITGKLGGSGDFAIGFPGDPGYLVTVRINPEPHTPDLWANPTNRAKYAIELIRLAAAGHDIHHAAQNFLEAEGGLKWSL